MRLLCLLFLAATTLLAVVSAFEIDVEVRKGMEIFIGSYAFQELQHGRMKRFNPYEKRFNPYEKRFNSYEKR